jgi:adenosylcobyric acid synthase
VAGRLADGNDATVRGYEIHLGVTEGPALARPALWLERATTAPDPRTVRYWRPTSTACSTIPPRAARCCAGPGSVRPEGVDLDALREASLARLADSLAANLDLGALFAPLGR